MGQVPRDTMLQMATALQKAVAMYFLLVDHAKGGSDLTEDQLEGVVEGVCQEAASALSEARRCGLVEAVPKARRPRRARGWPAPGPDEAVH